MNRVLFIISLVLVFVGGYFMFAQQVSGGFLIVFIVGTLVCIFRRVHLRMKPWWGGRLKDIPEYFTRP